MSENRCKLNISVIEENGHFKVNGVVQGETELVYQATVYALSVIARQVVSPKTISSKSSVPVSDWSINEYRKEFIQEVCEAAYTLLCNTEELSKIEKEAKKGDN